jgi:hypothetical protein
LNDELGAKEAGEGEVTASGPKERSPDTGARQVNFPPDRTEETASGANVPIVSRPVIPKPTSQINVTLSAHRGLDRRSNVSENRQKSNADEADKLQ